MRFCTAAEAVDAIPDAATVLIDGSGGGVNEPGTVLRAVQERFESEARPAGLTLLHVSGMGSGHGDGVDYLASKGLVHRVIGGHWAWGRKMQELAADEDIEAYCLPQGTISHLLRDIAAGRPGHLSKVGLGTFIDPRISGGRLNESAESPINEIVTIRGEELIFTPAFPIDVAIIRATTADEDGNLTMEGEGLLAETLASAQAAKNSGGIVIAQVRQRAARHSIIPADVRVPGILVDYVVVEPEQRLSYATHRDPVMEGVERLEGLSIPAIPLSERKVIGRRAAALLRSGDTVNLGFGMPDGVAAVLAEEGLQDEVVFTVEQGHIGGVPAGGSDFGLARNPSASFEAGAQFDWYDGGGIDTAVLSFAEFDRFGNVNVSRFGRRMPGVGGFVNISQGARRVIFVGTFVAKGPWVVGEGKIELPDGGVQKLSRDVQQISFSAQQALRDGRSVHYVTERAVFELTEHGPRLIEIAPGIDLERDVLSQMGFEPEIAEDLQTMDQRLFSAERLALSLQV